MVTFLGIDFSRDRVRAVFCDRDLRTVVAHSTPVANVRPDANGAGASVVPAEWKRAGAWLTQEAWLDLPVDARRIWGIGFSGPAGWIALDLEYRPLSDLRLVAGDSVTADLRAWLDADARRSQRVAAVLAPKDWFRFAISRNLATDRTQAAPLGLLDDAFDNWSAARIREAGFEGDWWPPVFPSDVRTGRIAPEGAETSGLPPDLWLVAGAASSECARLAAGDPRRGRLWAPPGTGTLLYGLPARPERVPAGFVLRPAPWPGGWSLERALACGEDPGSAAGTARRDLEAAGHTVEEIVSHAGDAARGAAALAAVASGILRDWDVVYRRKGFGPEPEPEEPSPEDGPGTGDGA